MPPTSDSAASQSQADHSTPSRRSAWRFSLWDILVFILGCAAGLAAYKSWPYLYVVVLIDNSQSMGFSPPYGRLQFDSDFFPCFRALNAVRLATSVWLIFGLLAQAGALWRTATKVNGVRRTDVSEILGAVFRVAVAGALVAYWVLDFISLRRSTEINLWSGLFRDIDFCAAVVLAAFLTRHAGSWWRRRATPEALLVLWAVAVPPAAVAFYDRLVESGGIAFRGIDRADLVETSSAVFMFQSFLVVPTVMGALFMLVQKGESPRRRRTYALVLAAATLVLLLPLAFSGHVLRSLPAMVQSDGSRIGAFLAAGVVCEAMVAGCLAYGWVAFPSRRKKSSGAAAGATATETVELVERSPTAPPEDRIYWHERRLVWALLSASLLVDFSLGWWAFIAENKYIGGQVSAAWLGYLVSSESVVPLLLAALVTMHAVVVPWRRAQPPPRGEAFSLRRYTLVFLGVNAVTILCMVSIALLGFRMWLQGRM
ncbi:MAG: hypothetical protein HYS13_21150 [Planctomycetia bacterium]|nr:hypothetical protein [Planctomycetia bacterium]